MTPNTKFERNIEITRRYLNGQIGQDIANEFNLSQPRIGAIVSSITRQAIVHCLRLQMEVSSEVCVCSPLQLRQHKEEVLKYIELFEKKCIEENQK
jgi:hypothetical protein